MDETWYSRYCAWWADGFPYDTYAPVTVHAGAKIVSLFKFFLTVKVSLSCKRTCFLSILRSPLL